MSEIEVPLEQIQEDIHHHAMHAHDRMVSVAAVSSALLAVCAAIAALLAGHHSNEAMLEQIQASDHWSHYQAKSIKAALLETKSEILKKEAGPKLEEYRHEQKELQEKAEEKEKASHEHLRVHETLAKAVTFFQVAIAVMAISVLARKKRFMFFALGFGIVGISFLAKALLLGG